MCYHLNNICVHLNICLSPNLSIFLSISNSTNLQNVYISILISQFTLCIIFLLLNIPDKSLLYSFQLLQTNNYHHNTTKKPPQPQEQQTNQYTTISCHKPHRYLHDLEPRSTATTHVRALNTYRQCAFTMNTRTISV